MSVRTVAVLSLVTFAACRGGKPFAVHDTEGWEYTAHCPGEGCSRILESPNPPRPSHPCASGERAAFAFAGRGVTVACHACVRGDVPRVTEPADCRALACENDRDCPPAWGGTALHCVHGLCQQPHERVDAVAAVALCMAGAGPAGHESAGERAARTSIAHASCATDGPCVASPACRGR